MSDARLQPEQIMDEAIRRCVQHVERGGLPFVGVVTDGNEVASEFAVNKVLETKNLTDHAEIVAMRDALRHQRGKLSPDSVLIATGEPCGMCFRFALANGITKIYTSVLRDEVAKWGFDYRASYGALGITEELRESVLHWLPVTNRTEPFIRFRDLNHR